MRIFAAIRNNLTPEISMCKGHLLPYKRYRKEIIFEDIQRIAWRIRSFYPEKQWEEKAKLKELSRKHKNMPKPCPMSEEELGHLRNVHGPEHQQQRACIHPLHSQLTGSWSTILTHCHKSTTLTLTLTWCPILMVSSMVSSLDPFWLVTEDTGHHSVIMAPISLAF